MLNREDYLKEFAKEALAYAEENNIASTYKKATSTTVKFEGLSLGYYLVNSSVGTLLHLTTTDPDGVVNEKNTVVPDVDKDVKENSTGEYGKENDAFDDLPIDRYRSGKRTDF